MVNNGLPYCSQVKKLLNSKARKGLLQNSTKVRRISGRQNTESQNRGHFGCQGTLGLPFLLPQVLPCTMTKTPGGEFCTLQTPTIPSSCLGFCGIPTFSNPRVATSPISSPFTYCFRLPCRILQRSQDHPHSSVKPLCMKVSQRNVGFRFLRLRSEV